MAFLLIVVLLVAGPPLVLTLLSLVLHWLPRWIFALGMFAAAALWASLANVFAAASTDLYDLWGHPPQSWVVMTIMLVAVALADAGAAVFVLLRGWQRVLLSLCLAIGLYVSLGITYAVYIDIHTAPLPPVSRYDGPRTGTITQVLLPGAVLASVFIVALALRYWPSAPRRRSGAPVSR